MVSTEKEGHRGSIQSVREKEVRKSYRRVEGKWPREMYYECRAKFRVSLQVHGPIFEVEAVNVVACFSPVILSFRSIGIKF